MSSTIDSRIVQDASLVDLVDEAWARASESAREGWSGGRTEGTREPDSQGACPWLGGDARASRSARTTAFATAPAARRL